MLKSVRRSRSASAGTLEFERVLAEELLLTSVEERAVLGTVLGTAVDDSAAEERDEPVKWMT